MKNQFLSTISLLIFLILQSCCLSKTTISFDNNVTESSFEQMSINQEKEKNNKNLNKLASMEQTEAVKQEIVKLQNDNIMLDETAEIIKRNCGTVTTENDKVNCKNTIIIPDPSGGCDMGSCIPQGLLKYILVIDPESFQKITFYDNNNQNIRFKISKEDLEKIDKIYGKKLNLPKGNYKIVLKKTYKSYTIKNAKVY